ncbi:hypothetical protein [Caulobacter soli]|uniref:hypothetical protein n=1 Tax=Caulobacter soli TaxID=2708539 RepID=UPI0013EA892C|nr:hypothetical protein [Caulobacter soli]
MGLTTSFFVCLLLLLPGLTGLAVWNFRGNRQTARRPELPLTAVNSLFVTFAISLAVHMIGVMAVELMVRAVREWNALDLPRLPNAHNPYPAAVGLLVARVDNAKVGDLYGLLWLIVFECAVVARTLMSQGVNLAFEGQDLRGVGWADKHFLQPLRHDYTPIGFVTLKITEDGRGVGYSGPIDELRLSADGEVKSVSLGQPQRFVYELIAGRSGGERLAESRVRRQLARQPEFEIYDPQWVGGVVHLSAERIETIVILNRLDEALRDEAADEADQNSAPSQDQPETSADV